MAKPNKQTKVFISQQLGPQPGEITARIFRFLNKDFCLCGRAHVAALFIGVSRNDISLSTLLDYCEQAWEDTWQHQQFRGCPFRYDNKKLLRDLRIIAALITMFG